VLRVNFVTSEYRIYLRVLRWVGGRLIRTGARTLNGSGACAFYKLQLTRTNTRDKETKGKKRGGRETPLCGKRYLRGIFTADDVLEDTAIGVNSGGIDESRLFPSAESQDEFSRSWRRSVAQIIVSRASRRGKWNFVISQQRGVPLSVFLWAKIFNHWIKENTPDAVCPEKSSPFHDVTSNRGSIVIDSNHDYHFKHQTPSLRYLQN